MTTTPHPKARRGGRTKPRTWLMWGRVWEGRIYQGIWESREDAQATHDHTEEVIRIRVTELRRGKGGGKR